MKQLLQEALDALMKLTDVGSVEEYGSNFEVVEASLRAAIDAPEQDPIASINCWTGDDHDGDPPRFIYSVKVHDAGKMLPKGRYELYTKPQQVAELADLDIDLVRDAETCPAGVICLSAVDTLWLARAVLAAQKGKQ